MFSELKEDQELIAFDELLRWVNETGLVTEKEARTIFKQINAYFYERCSFPVLPDDTKSDQVRGETWNANRIFRLNLHFLIPGYAIDDGLEKCDESEVKQLIDCYNILEDRMAETYPKFPSIAEMKQSLCGVENMFLKSAVATLVDYANKHVIILLDGGEIAEEKVLNYRKRLSSAIAVYLDALLSTTKTGCEISEREMLWRRSIDALPMIAAMPIEIFSGSLTAMHTLPMSEFYKLYLLFCLFSSVINDLCSYERDKQDDSNSIIKVWFREGSVTDMAAATLKVSKILDAIIQHVYLFVEEGKASHPELTVWFEYFTTILVGSIYAHTTVVPRYACSPFKVTVVEVQENMISEWLGKTDEYGQRVVQQFMENLNDPRKKDFMDSLCGAS